MVSAYTRLDDDDAQSCAKFWFSVYRTETAAQRLCSILFDLAFSKVKFTVAKLKWNCIDLRLLSIFTIFFSLVFRIFRRSLAVETITYTHSFQLLLKAYTLCITRNAKWKSHDCNEDEWKANWCKFWAQELTFGVWKKEKPRTAHKYNMKPWKFVYHWFVVENTHSLYHSLLMLLINDTEPKTRRRR